MAFVVALVAVVVAVQFLYSGRSGRWDRLLFYLPISPATTATIQKMDGHYKGHYSHYNETKAAASASQYIIYNELATAVEPKTETKSKTSLTTDG